MKAFKRQFTEKFPWLYIIDLSNYTISTVKEEKYNKTLAQIEEKKIEELTRAQAMGLEAAGWTVIRK